MGAGLLAALGFVGGVLIDKFELSKRRLAMQLFLPALFVSLAGCTFVLALVAPSTFSVSPGAGTLHYLVPFAAMIALAVAWNMFYYQALAKETVQEFDLILLTEPLVTIVLASAFFPQERNALLLLLALIAAVALIVAHMHHRKIRFDRYASGLLVAVFLISLEVLMIRILLQVYSPVALYLFRTCVLAGIFMAMYHPRITRARFGDLRIVAYSAGFGVLQMVARFFGYAGGGVVLTTLILLLGPVIVEVVGVAVLRERLKSRSAVAFGVICICVTFASIIALR